MNDLVNYREVDGISLPIIYTPPYRLVFERSTKFLGELGMEIEDLNDEHNTTYIELSKSDMMLLNLAMTRWLGKDKE